MRLAEQAQEIKALQAFIGAPGDLPYNELVEDSARQAREHTAHLALCAEAQAKSSRERLQLEDRVAWQEASILSGTATIQHLLDEIATRDAALTEQAQAHDKCIAEIQADQLTMANREHELHEKKDREITGLHESMRVLTEALGAISRMVPCYDAKGTASMQISRIVDVALAHPQVRAWLKESKR